VQALYAIEIAGNPVETVIADGLAGIHDPRPGAGAERTLDRAFFAELVRTVAGHQGEIDARIAGALASGLRLERLEALIRAILRAGTAELALFREVPLKVVIDEYLQISHAFFLGNEPALVNGVLDRLAAELRGGAPAAPDPSGTGP
jgi:N utilization substance protein B